MPLFDRILIYLVIAVCFASLMVSAAGSTEDPSIDQHSASHDEPAATSSAVPSASDEAAAAKQRRREGDLVQAQGRFEATGDRITFYADENQEVFGALENLALERIARILEDPSGRGRSRKWSVTGVITEFRGSNYLLIERAVLKAR